MVAMLRLSRWLLLAGLLSGCASDVTPGTAASCCAAPAPGTIKVHTNGEVMMGVGVSR
jgi:hypothetical protein